MKNYNIITLCLFLAACSDGTFEAKKTESYSLDENLGMVSSKKAPIIECDLFKNSDPSVWRHVNTNSDLDKFSTNLKENDLVTINCSQTKDDLDNENIKFAIDTDYDVDNPNFVAIEGSELSFTAEEVGNKTYAVKATGSSGLERIKTFSLITECRSAQVPVVDASQISITKGSKLNHFNYSVPASALSGGSDFLFSWDFNGDGSYDPVDLKDPVLWTSKNNLSDIYNTYVTTANERRNISLKVRNECNLETNVSISVNFNNVNIARNETSKAVQKPYWYIQANIASPTNSEDQRRNAEILLTQYPEDEPLKRIQCDYKKTRVDQNAVFVLKAFNQYKADSIYNHGLDIRIEDIEDNLSQGLQEIPNMRLASLNYMASEIDDALSQEQYQKTSECQVAMRIIRAKGVSPCAPTEQKSADFEEQDAIIIMGEFSCPELEVINGSKQVDARNGKFFCEVAPVNQCVGGGGGGGGIPPPKQ